MSSIIITKFKELIKDERIRFLIVGCINTAVGYSLFVVFIFIGLHYLLAYILATIVGVFVSYILNKSFTFRKHKKSYAEAIRFVSVYAMSFLIGNVALYIMVDVLYFVPYLAGALNLIFTTIISWFGHKYFSFRS